MASWKQIVEYVEEHLDKTSENNFFTGCTYTLCKNLIILSVHVDFNYNICVHISKIECGISNNMIEINVSCLNKVKDDEKLKQALSYLNTKICSGLVISENGLEIRSYQFLNKQDSEINDAEDIIYFAFQQGHFAWEVSQLIK